MSRALLLLCASACWAQIHAASFDVKAWFTSMDSGRMSKGAAPHHCEDDGTRCLSAFSFDGIGVPSGADQDKPLWAQNMKISDTALQGTTDYSIIALEGQDWRSANPYNGDTFGVIKSKTGQVIAEPRAGGELFSGQSNMPDYVSLMYTGIPGKVHAIVHLENIPASTVLLELAQNQTTGELKLIKSTEMDWSSYGGLHAPCAGSLSPWNTHMGSEEWGPPDARAMEACQDCTCASKSYASYMMQYHDVARECTDFNSWKAKYDEHYSPYLYNWAWESGIDGVPVKHMAMGRRGTELPYVMPDEKTVYLTDDSYSAVLTVFVADTPRDLSAGTLKCAVMSQKSDVNGGSFDVMQWKDMGHATTAEIQTFVLGTPRPKFSDLFDTAAPNETDFTCPDGFTGINAGGVGPECLKVKTGMDKLASRLETRRYAAMLGCTSEFSRQEGVTYSAETGKLYMGMTSIRKGMTDGHDHDKGGPNEMRLPENKCGCVYEFDMDSSFLVTNMKGLICGTPPADPANPTDPENWCDVNGISNPDNVASMHGHKMLLIAEDTSNHFNNIMWLYDLEQRELVGRIGSTPQGAEVCSPYFYPDVGGFSYITMVMQHPDKDAYGPSGIGYVAWERDCTVEYPSFSMPGHGSADRCKAPTTTESDSSRGGRHAPTFVMAMAVLTFMVMRA